MVLKSFHSSFSAFSLYNNIHHPSKLAVGADFYCFKNKIEPKWEDPVCANGGKWTVIFPKGKSDTSWLYTVCLDSMGGFVCVCWFISLILNTKYGFKFVHVLGSCWQ